MSEKKYLIQDIQLTEASDVLSRVRDLKAEGYRLVQMCAAAIAKDKTYQLTYSFDKDHVLLNLRIIITDGVAVESITGEYWPAFIYENEMHDLFGIEFKHNALDYGGHFFKVSEPTPWKNK